MGKQHRKVLPLYAVATAYVGAIRTGDTSNLGVRSMSTSWVAEVIADSGGKWTRNACRFATKEEAEEYVADLYARWAMVRQTRVVECDEPVNHSWDKDTGRVRDPLPRITGDLEVTPVTDADQFVSDIMDDARALREQRNKP